MGGKIETSCGLLKAVDIIQMKGMPMAMQTSNQEQMRGKPTHAIFPHSFVRPQVA
jgi:hypothetical protein